MGARTPAGSASASSCRAPTAEDETVRAVLFVGAGRHQRRAIVRARELGLRVVAVDRNENAPGLAEADIGETVDFTDADAVIEDGRRHRVDGVLTV